MAGTRSHCRQIGHEAGYQHVTATRQKASTRFPISVSGAESSCCNASSLPHVTHVSVIPQSSGFKLGFCVSRCRHNTAMQPQLPAPPAAVALGVGAVPSHDQPAGPIDGNVVKMQYGGCWSHTDLVQLRRPEHASIMFGQSMWMVFVGVCICRGHNLIHRGVSFFFLAFPAGPRDEVKRHNSKK